MSREKSWRVLLKIISSISNYQYWIANAKSKLLRNVHCTLGQMQKNRVNFKWKSKLMQWSILHTYKAKKFYIATFWWYRLKSCICWNYVRYRISFAVAQNVMLANCLAKFVFVCFVFMVQHMAYAYLILRSENKWRSYLPFCRILQSSNHHFASMFSLFRLKWI